MAEQESGRSEKPTPFKLEEARKKGQVLHVPDLVSFGILCGWVFVALFLLDGVIRQTFLAARYFWGVGLHGADFAYVSRMMWDTAYSMALPLLWMALFALVSVLVQHRPVFSVQPLKPDWSRINPAQGIKRFFSLRTLAALGTSLLKVILLVLAALVLFSVFMTDIVVSIGHPVALWPLLKRLFVWTMGALILLFGIFAAVDYVLQQRLFTKQMMMSRREILDENKRREGDPLIKRRLREYRLELLKKIRALKSVPDADFVIINPTHYAVAIKYNPAVIDAPVVLAKGGGALAQQIRLLARRSGVPVFARRKLTRAVFFSTAIGSAIEAKHYREVALLLKQVRRQKKSRHVLRT